MRVTARDLVAWSFLMATAHGAGLMLLPFLLRTDNEDSAQAASLAGSHTDHAAHMAQVAESTSGSIGWFPNGDLLSVLVHSAAMFAVMGAVALGVYRWLGLKILRRGWFNVDRIWAIMLVMAGAFSFAA
jgi:hypothetical protein